MLNYITTVGETDKFSEEFGLDFFAKYSIELFNEITCTNLINWFELVFGPNVNCSLNHSLVQIVVELHICLKKGLFLSQATHGTSTYLFPLVFGKLC